MIFQGRGPCLAGECCNINIRYSLFTKLDSTTTALPPGGTARVRQNSYVILGCTVYQVARQQAKIEQQKYKNNKQSSSWLYIELAGQLRAIQLLNFTTHMTCLFTLLYTTRYSNYSFLFYYLFYLLYPEFVPVYLYLN